MQLGSWLRVLRRLACIPVLLILLGTPVARFRPVLAGAQTPGQAAPASTVETPEQPPCNAPSPSALQGKAPGDLIAAVDITPQADAAFPDGAKAWRVLYVSTGIDNHQTVLVCGIVVAPSSAQAIAVQDRGGKPTANVVAWSHGTLGVVAGCQPSLQPDALIWAPTPWGIDQASWATGRPDETVTGDSQDGMLAGMVNAGWIVVATDYDVDLSGGTSTLLPFILGKVEAANDLDAVRAGDQLLHQQYADYRTDAYQLAVWGHSQGGHTALWAAQLASSYYAATASSSSPEIHLAGAVAEAPGSDLVVDPNAGIAQTGYGLVDWVLHVDAAPAGSEGSLILGPWFLSYLLGAWQAWSSGATPDTSAMPAFPPSEPLNLAGVVTADGQATIQQLLPLCWDPGDLPAIAQAVSEYADPTQHSYLVPALSNGQTIDGLLHGNLDTSCANSPMGNIKTLCDWLMYNLPGPLGKNPFVTAQYGGGAPADDGNLVPLLIAQGTNDTVVRCATSDSPAAPPDAYGALVPSADDCIGSAVYDSYLPYYCPSGGPARGYLSELTWRYDDGVTTADHSAVTGLVGAANLGELAYEGSPLQQFLIGAFSGSLAPGCTATLAN